MFKNNLREISLTYNAAVFSDGVCVVMTDGSEIATIFNYQIWTIKSSELTKSDGKRWIYYANMVVSGKLMDFGAIKNIYQDKRVWNI